MRDFKLSSIATKAQVKRFINDRLHGEQKIKRISTYKKDVIIFETITPANGMVFSPTFCNIQSVSYKGGFLYTVLTINNTIHGIGSIISEIEYFRRNPKYAEERNITVI